MVGNLKKAAKSSLSRPPTAMTCDVSPELEDYFKTAYPKALARVKELAEK